MPLSPENVALMHRFMALLHGLLAEEAVKTAPQRRRQGQPKQAGNPADEVLLLPHQLIPERHFRRGAERAYRVTTDSMRGARLAAGAIIFVRPATSAADGDLIVCRLNGVLYLKRLERRGRRKTLVSANPRYPVVTVRRTDDFALIGVVTR